MRITERGGQENDLDVAVFIDNTANDRTLIAKGKSRSSAPVAECVGRNNSRIDGCGP